MPTIIFAIGTVSSRVSLNSSGIHVIFCLMSPLYTESVRISIESLGLIVQSAASLDVVTYGRPGGCTGRVSAVVPEGVEDCGYRKEGRNDS
jgi:hypothetical protein